MKILIVDDEVIIRTGLCMVIDWKELGMTLLPPAESAEEALACLQEQQPDIVLTDIRMTGMDGIELAREMKQLQPDAEVIILTGYDDFGYAQKALREGVTDYLLKTSGPEEIIRAVMKAKQNLQAKWELKKQGEAQETALRNQQFGQWLTGSGNRAADLTGFEAAKSWLEQSSVLCTEPSGGCVPMRVLMVGVSGWGDDRFGDLMLEAGGNQLLEFLPCVTLLKNHAIIVVTRSGEGWSGTRQLEKAIDKVRDTLKCELFAAAGDIVSSLEELRRSYEEAAKVYTYRVLFGDRGLYEMKDIAYRQGGRVVCSGKEENELSALLVNNNAPRLHQWTSRIVKEQLEDPETTPATLSTYLQSVIIAAHRWLDRAKEEPGKPAVPVPSLAFEPGGRLEDELFRLLLPVMNEFHQFASDSRFSYIHRATAYIRNHIDQPLTLSQVANFVHLNPNHFSEVFKKETGQGYIEFVTRERMLRASNILLTTPKKISEIAGEVGYEDMKYFSQQFKKIMGCTPSEYRQSSTK